MTALDSELLFYLAAGGIGLLVGLGLGYLAHAKLRAELQVKSAALKSQQDLELERDRALELATERLSATFGQLANREFQNHS